jgi:hypothetical protein
MTFDVGDGDGVSKGVVILEGLQMNDDVMLLIGMSTKQRSLLIASSL